MSADSLAQAAGGALAGSAGPGGEWMRLGAQRLGADRLMAFVNAVEGWHEFYLLAGTAAVTLVGLLFVALSFHLDTLLDESKAHLLAAARLTFMNYVFVLVLSLMFLVPRSGPGMLGLFSIAISVIGLGFGLVTAWKSRMFRNTSAHEKFLKRRFILTNVAFALTLANGVLLIADPRPTWLYNYVSLVCMLLGNGAGASWDLLVQVGRLRRAQEQTPGR